MMETKFKIGDRVWHIVRGWGEVFSKKDAGAVLTVVFFDATVDIDHRELFFEEILIPKSARTRPKPQHKCNSSVHVICPECGKLKIPPPPPPCRTCHVPASGFVRERSGFWKLVHGWFTQGVATRLKSK